MLQNHLWVLLLRHPAVVEAVQLKLDYLTHLCSMRRLQQSTQFSASICWPETCGNNSGRDDSGEENQGEKKSRSGSLPKLPMTDMWQLFRSNAVAGVLHVCLFFCVCFCLMSEETRRPACFSSITERIKIWLLPSLVPRPFFSVPLDRHCCNALLNVSPTISGVHWPISAIYFDSLQLYACVFVHNIVAAAGFWRSGDLCGRTTTHSITFLLLDNAIPRSLIKIFMSQKKRKIYFPSQSVCTYKTSPILPSGGRGKNAFPSPITSMEVCKGFILGQIRWVPKRAFCPGVRFWVASPFREDQRLNVHTGKKYGPARWSPITPRQRLSLSMCPEIRNPVRFFFSPPSASRMYCVLISRSVTLWKNRKILWKVFSRGTF